MNYNRPVSDIDSRSVFVQSMRDNLLQSAIPIRCHQTTLRTTAVPHATSRTTAVRHTPLRNIAVAYDTQHHRLQLYDTQAQTIDAEVLPVGDIRTGNTCQVSQ